MITEKRVVLVIEDYKSIAFEKGHFEALEIIEKEEEIKKVWYNNKLPLIEKKNITENIKNNYSILEIPQQINNVNTFISFCHQNELECGEFVSGENFNISKNDCFLCNISDNIDTIGVTTFNHTLNRRDDLVMYESENFIIKIELGCLIKGMVMICPKQHILSVANISDTCMEEYNQIMKDIEFLLKCIYGYGPVIFFEHGSAPNCLSSHKRSIVHAHTHVAWGVKLEQKYLDLVHLKEINDIREYKDVKYLSYQEGTEGPLMLTSDPEIYIPRQYPRQVIGKLLGIENSKTNWRNEPFTQNMEETFYDFYSFIKLNKSFLSERIIRATEGFIMGYELLHQKKIA